MSKGTCNEVGDPAEKVHLEVARRVLVLVVACSLSAEVWTPWIEFILQHYAYFSPNIKDQKTTRAERNRWGRRELRERDHTARSPPDPTSREQNGRFPWRALILRELPRAHIGQWPTIHPSRRPKDMHRSASRAMAPRIDYGFPTAEESVFPAHPGRLSAMAVASIMIPPQRLRNGTATDFALNFAWYGEIAFRNHRQYCAAHGFDYTIRTVSYTNDEREPTWQKSRLVLSLLLRGHTHIFWTDGDAVFTNMRVSLVSCVRAAEELKGEQVDLIFTGDMGGLVNAGQLLFRNTAWTAAFLRELDRRTHTQNYGCDCDPTVLGCNCSLSMRNSWLRRRWPCLSPDPQDNGNLLLELAAGRDCTRRMRGTTERDCEANMAFLRDVNPVLATKVQCLPQRRMNSYPAPARGKPLRAPRTERDKGGWIRAVKQGVWQPCDLRLHAAGPRDRKLAQLIAMADRRKADLARGAIGQACL